MENQLETKNKPEPEYEFFKCTCKMTNGDVPLIFGTASLKHGKWETPPSTVPANSVDYVAFKAEGRSYAAEGTAGTVSYSFLGVYGNVNLNLTFNVPYSGHNDFTAGISDNVNGDQGYYDCTYTTSQGDQLDSSVTITFVPSGS